MRHNRNLAAFAFDPAATRAPVTLPAPPEGLALAGYRETVREIAGRRARVMIPAARGARALERAAILETDPEASAPGDPVQRRAKVWRIETNPAVKLLPPDQRQAAIEYAAAVEALEGGRGQDFLNSGGGAPGSRPPSLGRLALAETVRRCDEALAGREIVLVVTCHVSPYAPQLHRISLRDALRAVAIEGLDRRAILARMGYDRGASHGTAHCEGRVSQGIAEAATRVAVALGIIDRRALDGFAQPAPRL